MSLLRSFSTTQRCLDASGRIYISKDVVFHEHNFPYVSLFSSSNTKSSPTACYPAEIVFPSFADEISSQLSQSSQAPTTPHSVPISTPASSNIPILVPSTSPLSVDQVNSQISQPLSTPIPDVSTPSVSHLGPTVISDHNNHPMVTRGKTGNLKPKVFLAALEPKNVRSALTDPKWRQAMQDEYMALMDNNTWSLVSLPPHRKAIGCKGIFRVKENPDGTVNKYKARLVAKGFLQTAGFDFTETFSPVIKPITIRIILTLAVTFKWQVQQIDVNNVFLNGVL
jgi:histone deacetylase 1/2